MSLKWFAFIIICGCSRIKKRLTARDSLNRFKFLGSFYFVFLTLYISNKASKMSVKDE